MQTVKLKYDGRWTWYPTQENRQWTILSTFIDECGANRHGGSFGLTELKTLGIVPLECKREEAA